MSEWDGKTKGSLAGYKFFVASIDFFGLWASYFFCNFVSFYYLIFNSQARKGLHDFYMKSFGYSKIKCFLLSRKTFYNFGVSLIDRFAMTTKRKNKFSYEFKNEEVLKEIVNQGKGGILVSAHLGNWEIAGSLIFDRVTSCINIVALDQEVEKIKEFLELRTGGPRYNVIGIKDDLSHLIKIKHALDNNELIAIHADRSMNSSKEKKVPFFNHYAELPIGPFIIAHKFKVPITYVFAMKKGNFHYALSATEIQAGDSPEELQKKYADKLEEMIKMYPSQWYNFYKFYVD